MSNHAWNRRETGTYGAGCCKYLQETQGVGLFMRYKPTVRAARLRANPEPNYCQKNAAKDSLFSRVFKQKQIEPVHSPKSPQMATLKAKVFFLAWVAREKALS